MSTDGRRDDDLAQHDQERDQERAAHRADSIPEGEWDVQCGQERFAVVGSALKPEWVSLAPSASIAAGMKTRLFHHYGLSFDECRQAPDLAATGDVRTAASMDYGSYVESDEFKTHPHSTTISTLLGTGAQDLSVSSDCVGSPAAWSANERAYDEALSSLAKCARARARD